MTTKAMITEAGLSVVADEGIWGLTREAVAERAGCSPALVSYHMGTMQELLEHLMQQAVERENLDIIAMGLVSRHPAALNAPAELKQAAIFTLQATV